MLSTLEFARLGWCWYLPSYHTLGFYSDSVNCLDFYGICSSFAAFTLNSRDCKLLGWKQFDDDLVHRHEIG